jgi:hypothetical protein
MGWACNKHGRDEKCIQNFGRKNLKGREYLEDLDVNGKVILELILGKCAGVWWT